MEQGGLQEFTRHDAGWPSTQRCPDCTRVVCECAADGDDDDEVEQDSSGAPEQIACKGPATYDLTGASWTPWRHVPDQEEEPDLEAYFNTLGVTVPDRIRLCRTYASYLAQRTKKRKKMNETDTP